MNLRDLPYTSTQWAEDFERAFIREQRIAMASVAGMPRCHPDELEDNSCPYCKGRGDVHGLVDGEAVDVDCNACDGTGEKA
jgi:DnaJ-class molecular chaperone